MNARQKDVFKTDFFSVREKNILHASKLLHRWSPFCSHSMKSLEAVYKSLQFKDSTEQNTEDALNHKSQTFLTKVSRSSCATDIEQHAYTK